MGSKRQTIPPKNDWMATDEVLAWIVFRQALPRADWGMKLFDWSRDWEFLDGVGDRYALESEPAGRGYRWPLSGRRLHSALKARKAGREYEVPDWAIEHRESVANYLTQLEMRTRDEWDALASAVQLDTQKQSRHLARLRQAAQLLRQALSVGKLKAAAQLPGDFQARSYVSSERWVPGVTIGWDGTAWEDEGVEARLNQRHYLLRRLTFDTSEVLAIWPAEKPSEKESGPDQDITPPRRPQVTPALLNRWWASYIEECQVNESVPTHQEQYESACDHFEGYVAFPQQRIVELRASPLTPSSWRRPGRRSPRPRPAIAENQSKPEIQGDANSPNAVDEVI